MHAVFDELEHFFQRDIQKSVLLFPPLPSRLRYLIHKTTEKYPNLATFSVGEDWCKRVVVCYHQLRRKLKEDSDTERSTSLYEEPYRLGGEVESKQSVQPRPTYSFRSQGAKCPKKAIYVPPAAREQQQLYHQGSLSKITSADVPILLTPDCNHSVNSAAPSCSRSCSMTETTKRMLLCSPSQDSATDSLPGCTANSLEQLLGKQKNISMQLSGAKPCPWDQAVSSFMAMTLEDPAEEMHGKEYQMKDSQASNLSGVALKITEDANNFCQEIVGHLKDVNFSIEHTHNDYSFFENLWINQDEFSHVIEIYDFPPMFTTEDLLDAFTEYSIGGFKIKWVDSTHALGVFSSKSAASHALSMHHSLLKTRTLSKGSRKSKSIAVRQAEFIQPVKERPRTDSTVARRMVTRALGLQRGLARVQRY